MDITLFNTVTRKKELFKPLKKGEIGLYCCGPTVYHFAHIGNMRTFIFEDFLIRTFEYNKFNIKHVMNITDVGHLTDDADDGEDKMEKGAAREGKTVWEVAEFYTDAYFEDAKRLNIKRPSIICKATSHIKEQIAMIQLLEDKGFTYVANGNVYFDTSKYPDYAKFANLKLDESKARVAEDVGKKNKHDFVLWFTNSKFKNHTMKWESPWGEGYPGWHIECSAMATKYLGKIFDIHCGGVDHISVHHTNEIAQSKCALDGDFAKYWMHAEFLIDQTGKMSKSKGEFLTTQLLIDKGYDPLSYRYLLCQTHYRKQLQFSFTALDDAQTSYRRLKTRVSALGTDSKGDVIVYQKPFRDAINDDINIPKALGILHEMISDDSLGGKERRALVEEFDEVFGLDLLETQDIKIPPQIRVLIEHRRKARENRDFAKSDELRDQLADIGYIVKDTKTGQTISKK